MLPNLSRREVRKVSKALRAAGLKLPRIGTCVSFRKSPGSSERRVWWSDRYAAEVCRDARGYYVVRSTTAFGRYRRRR